MSEDSFRWPSQDELEGGDPPPEDVESRRIAWDEEAAGDPPPADPPPPPEPEAQHAPAAEGAPSTKEMLREAMDEVMSEARKAARETQAAMWEHYRDLTKRRRQGP